LGARESINDVILTKAALLEALFRAWVLFGEQTAAARLATVHFIVRRPLEALGRADVLATHDCLEVSARESFDHFGHTGWAGFVALVEAGVTKFAGSHTGLLTFVMLQTSIIIINIVAGLGKSVSTRMVKGKHLQIIENVGNIFWPR